MFNAFGQAATAVACVIILMTYVVVGTAIAPNVSRYKADAAKRARQSEVSASLKERSAVQLQVIDISQLLEPHGAIPDHEEPQRLAA